MSSVAEQLPLEAANAAFARHAWAEAYERFAEADRVSPLPPADLERYAEAAWWSGEPTAALGIRERAYAAHLDGGDRRAAAMVALRLFIDNVMKASFTMANAWIGHADRLLADDTDSREYGHLLLHRGVQAGDTGDPDGAIAKARAALELAIKHRDSDLHALALVLQGSALVTKGQMKEGMRFIDEATIAAVTGELTLIATGSVYCSIIGACRDIADYRRASEFTEAAIRWCERQSVNGFPGICRVHRADILALRGAFARAEQEARLARDELARWGMGLVLGESFYEIGFIRMRMGDLPAAEEAFLQAHTLGRTPEPGMSLLRLAQGKADSANASLRRALAEERSVPGRARLLPAQVEVALAAGDLTTARAATDELEGIAASFDTLALKAALSTCRGAVALGEGDPASAGDRLGAAIELWQQLDAPYETAQTRMLLARARRALADEDGARMELAAAKATFERIGARRDARSVAAELGEIETATPPAGGRVARTFLFTDIVSSTQLIAVIGDAAWQDLIRWHDDTLRAVIAEHEGQEVRHQGDGLVVAFEEPAAAIDCAIAIQRRLADHRRAHGFAPAVRIGLHRTEATPRGLDYAGVGVHQAARIGALAAEGEILVTRETLGSVERTFATGPSRTVELKGISGSVEVVSIPWR